MNTKQLAQIFDVNLNIPAISDTLLSDIASVYHYDALFAMPRYIDDIKALNENIKLASFVGLPNGENLLENKFNEARTYIDKGVDKLVLLIDHANIKNRNYEAFMEEVTRIRGLCLETEVDYMLYVDLLSSDELARTLRYLKRMDINEVVLSTYRTNIKLDDIKLVKTIMGPKAKITLFNKIDSFKEVIEYVKHGISHFIVDNPETIILDFKENYAK